MEGLGKERVLGVEVGSQLVAFVADCIGHREIAANSRGAWCKLLGWKWIADCRIGASSSSKLTSCF